MITILQLAILIFLGLSFFVTSINLLTTKKFGELKQSKKRPKVSILIPARNEENEIGDCVKSILSQNYPNFEVLVLDDESTDGTWANLGELAKMDEKLRIIKGKPLPKNWLGKNWACHQLSKLAKGDLLLFTDADTYHHSETLSEAVDGMIDLDADLLTAPCYFEVISWAEKFLMPIIHWGMFCFLPLPLAYHIRNPYVSISIGVFMLFKREVYEAIGGHESVKETPVEDMYLGRRIKADGFKWRILDGSNRVSCRNYHNMTEVMQGFSRFFFGPFENNVLLFIIIISVIGVAYLEPPIIFGLGLLGWLPEGFSFSWACFSLAFLVATWGLMHWRFRYPLYLTPLYPITIILAIIIAYHSIFLLTHGKAIWKDRLIDIDSTNEETVSEISYQHTRF